MPKLNLDTHSVSEGIRTGGRKNRMEGILSGGSFNFSSGEKEIVYVPIDQILERPINDYPQEGIDALAEDIKANGLDQPLLLTRGKDIPENSRVAKAFAAQGIKKDSVTFITAGHRRWRAFQILHKQEVEELDSLTPFKYDRVPAIFLTPEEAIREEEIFNGSNVLARNISEFTFCFNIRDQLVLSTDTVEKQKDAMKRMLGRDLIPSDRFSEAKYAVWYIEKVYGHKKKLETIKQVLMSMRKLPYPVQKAVAKEEYPDKYATMARKLNEDIQLQLLEEYMKDDSDNKDRYHALLESYTKKNSEKKRYSYDDVIGLGNGLLKELDKAIDSINTIYPFLGDKDKKTSDSLRKDIESFKKTLNSNISKFED